MAPQTEQLLSKLMPGMVPGTHRRQEDNLSFCSVNNRDCNLYS